MIYAASPDRKDIISQIVRLEAEAFGDGGLNAWNLMPLIRHGRVFCLEEDGHVIGCIQYMLDWHDHAKAYAVGISIASDQRGKGRGTELFGATMDILSAEGISSVELTVDAANAAAVAVYQRKLGFVTTGQRLDEYGEGVHRIVMEKILCSDEE